MSKGARKKLRVAVVTGSRAEFGLLEPVMRAIQKHSRLRLQVVAAGSHFLAPARTIRDVERAFPLAARVPMQRPKKGVRTRLDDAGALGRGVEGFASAFARLKPDWVVVLGDRIEAFAAASAASVGGIAVAHIHGGDRAEGIADEAMRHAITKLSHLHLVATEQSAERVVRMGERPEHVHMAGSSAIDGIGRIRAMSDRDAAELGDPSAVVLLHPSGLTSREERGVADAILSTLGWVLTPTLILAPNHDPGREAIMDSIRHTLSRVHYRSPMVPGQPGPPPLFTFREHLPREKFLALLKRIGRQRRIGKVKTRGFLIGNSSAGLIECAAMRVPVVNVGPRQAGRERGDNVIDAALNPDLDPGLWAAGSLENWVLEAMFRSRGTGKHPYGDGRSGARIARLLAATGPHDPSLLRKHNTY